MNFVTDALASLPRFASVQAMLAHERPAEPVYCLYPEALQRHAEEFLAAFPGTVLYAVKANDEVPVLRLLHAAGVRHFDCASLPEIELVARHCPDSTAYFMIPVRLRGAARSAFEKFGTRHFMIDQAAGLAALAAEVPLQDCVVFTRMAVHHAAAMLDLSSKFGAPPAEVPALLAATRETGAEPALAFNVGSAVLDPEAYRYAMGVARETLLATPFAVRLLDIGGGYPRAYPGFPVPPLADYFKAVRDGLDGLPLAPQGQILCEPGRALAAPGVSAVVEVLMVKSGRLYVNDGMYGAFWELRFGMHDRYAVRAFRNGQPLAGSVAGFRLYGPTCDSSDVLPGQVELPQAIQAGDYLEFGQIGAYSLAGRTRFNGHFSDRLAIIDGPGASPPG